MPIVDGIGDHFAVSHLVVVVFNGNEVIIIWAVPVGDGYMI